MGGPVSSSQALAPKRKAMRTIAVREVCDEKLGLWVGSKPLRDRTLFFITRAARLHSHITDLTVSRSVGWNRRQ